MNDHQIKFVFGEKEDYYFAHIIETDGKISIEMKFSKDLYNCPSAFRFATMVFKDSIL